MTLSGTAERLDQDDGPPKPAALDQQAEVWAGERQILDAAALLVLTAIALAVFEYVRHKDEGAGAGGAAAVLGAAALIVAAGTRLAGPRRKDAPRNSFALDSTLKIAFVTTLVTLVFPATLAYFAGATPSNEEIADALAAPQASLWLLALFLAVSALTYRQALRRPRERLALNRRVVPSRSLRAAFAAGMLVSLANLAWRGRSIDGRTALPPILAPFEQGLAYGPALSYIAIAGLASSSQRRDRSTAIVMTIAVALVGVGDGFFKPAYWAAMTLALASQGSPATGLRGVRRRHSRRLLYLVGGAALVVVVIPIVQATRAEGTSGSLTADLQTAFEDSWGKGLGNGWDFFVDKAMGRQAGVLAGATRAVDRIPERISFQGPDGMLALPATFIPRFAWPSKPVVTGGAEVTRLFYDGPANSTTSNTLLLFGDAYWIYGLPAVFVIAALFGLVLAKIDTAYRDHSARLVKFGLLPTILNLEANVRTWLLATLQGLLVLTIIVYFMGRPKLMFAPRPEMRIGCDQSQTASSLMDKHTKQGS